MSEDTTLDAFAGGADGADAADDTSDDAPGSDPAADAPAPVAVTSSWRDGATCAACGDPASRRWQNGGERVCAACAAWTTSGRGACDQ